MPKFELLVPYRGSDLRWVDNYTREPSNFASISAYSVSTQTHPGHAHHLAQMETGTKRQVIWETELPGALETAQLTKGNHDRARLAARQWSGTRRAWILPAQIRLRSTEMIVRAECVHPVLSGGC